MKSSSKPFKVNRYAKAPPQAGNIESKQFPLRKKKKKKTIEDDLVTQVKKKKKKVSAEEETSKKKKKKTELSTSRELVVANPKQQQKIAKNMQKLNDQIKNVQSTFGLREADIMAHLEEGDSENSILMFQKQAYATMLKLIPVAEREYMIGKRDHQAYVLNALISQARELAADLQASGDRQQLAEIIISEILEPTFKGILQFMMQEQMQLKALLNDKIKPQFVSNATHEMDESLKSIAQSMNALYKLTADNIRKKLLGD